MQRHFSNRGEPLAEVTAARMLAAKRRAGKPGFASQPVSWSITREVVLGEAGKTHTPRKPRIQRGSEESGIQL